jgi:hypothetical protein
MDDRGICAHAALERGPAFALSANFLVCRFPLYWLFADQTLKAIEADVTGAAAKSVPCVANWRR